MCLLLRLHPAPPTHSDTDTTATTTAAAAACAFEIGYEGVHAQARKLAHAHTPSANNNNSADDGGGGGCRQHECVSVCVCQTACVGRLCCTRASGSRVNRK